MRMSKKSLFLKGASMLCIGASLLLMSACNGAQKETTVNEADEQQIYIGDNIAVAQTQYGKVRGFIQRGVYTYLGIRYGADTSGENRFMPAKAPEPWTDIKDAVYYGNCAPQNDPNYANNRGVWRDHWNYSNLSEDCLFLNVWTPNTDNAKRPVMVWFHGGGYSAGNGIEQDGYNGENMAKKGDVVFVSVNHRLNAFGFSDFSGVDPKYFESGNVGMGECALVPQHSPICESGILFYNTLFDENASCHLAMGMGYADTIDGFQNMTLERCRELGINDSMIHEDFMIGCDTMNIDGICEDGSTVAVFRNGNWAF